MMDRDLYKEGYLAGFHDGRDSILHPEQNKKQIIEEELHHTDHPDWGTVTCAKCQQTWSGVVFHECSDPECPDKIS
jgi:hypothetical protein